MKDFQIIHETIKTKLPGGPVRIVFLSDLHNREFGPENCRLLDAIDREQPDLILIGGDQIVAKPGADLTPGLFTTVKLAEKYPVCYANGNHETRLALYPETYGDAYQRFREVIDVTSVCYLDGTSEDLEIHGRKLRISGFNMPRDYYYRFYRGGLPVEELTGQLGPVREDAFHILMAHHPGYAVAYDDYRADLVLSGHYHGGVVGLPGNRGLITPDFRLFHSFCRGRHDLSRGGIQIISAGTGEHTIPFRIFNPRELIVIDIRNA